MKYFFFAFVAFATIYSASALGDFGASKFDFTLALDPVPSDFGTTDSGRIQLGNALEKQINKIVEDIVNYLAANIVEFIPATSELDLDTVESGLKALGKVSTVVAILKAIFKLFKFDGSEIIDLIPIVVANVKVSIPNLWDNLASELAPGATHAPFGVVLTNVGVYLLSILVQFFIKFLNDLSNP